MLDLVAGGTKRDHPHKDTCASRLIVLPHFVALDRMAKADAFADLAAVIRLAPDNPPNAIPVALSASVCRLLHQQVFGTSSTVNFGTAASKSDSLPQTTATGTKHLL